MLNYHLHIVCMAIILFCYATRSVQNDMNKFDKIYNISMIIYSSLTLITYVVHWIYLGTQ